MTTYRYVGKLDSASFKIGDGVTLDHPLFDGRVRAGDIFIFSESVEIHATQESHDRRLAFMYDGDVLEIVFDKGGTTGKVARRTFS